MRTSKTTFSDKLLRNIKVPPSGRTEIGDAGCRGLRFRVTDSGDRSFSFRYRTERVRIGTYPGISLHDARKEADRLRQDIDKGGDPAERKRTAGERTFAVLADRYLEEHARRKKRTAEEDAAMLRKHVLPYWKGFDYTAIRRADVIKLVERIVKAGTPIAANRVQALVSKVFSFALDAALIENHPALRMSKRSPENVKTRVLSDDEIRLFWKLAVSTPTVGRASGLALRLCLVLGCRANEIAGMRRPEVEFCDGKPLNWMIPEERAKNGLALLVPLSPLAVDLISTLVALGGEGDAILPSRGNGDRSVEGHALTVAMRRLSANIPDDLPGADTWAADAPTLHDLRRTMATRMGKARVPNEHIAAVLNHKPTGVTKRHYNLHEMEDEKREAWARWSQTLGSILNPPPSNVLPLGPHGRRWRPVTNRSVGED